MKQSLSALGPGVAGLVSAVIPAYNGAEYLREAIQSALAQTYQPLEIVVVDDGSKDHTRQVCESFGPPVKYVFQENDGTFGAGARARAIFESRGEWIALLDQDDRWLPTKLAVQVDSLGAHPQAGVAYTNFLTIDAQGHALSGESARLPLLAAAPGEAFHQFLRDNPYCASSGLFRRGALTPDDLQQTATADPADWDLWLRITRNHDSIYVPDVLVEYRVHAENHTSNSVAYFPKYIEFLKSYRSQLHEGCRKCVEAQAAGVTALSTRLSRLLVCDYLDRGQQEAAEGRPVEGFRSFLRAARIAPLQALRPGRCAALMTSTIRGIGTRTATPCNPRGD